MYMADPHALKAILRAEGKYPTRFRDIDDKMAWFYTHMGYPAPVGFA